MRDKRLLDLETVNPNPKMTDIQKQNLKKKQIIIVSVSSIITVLCIVAMILVIVFFI